MTEGSPNRFAEQWIECRSQGQGHATIEAEICQGQADYCVDGPRMQSPMKDGSRHANGASRSNIAGIDAQWRLQCVADGFQHTVEHQANADSRREQHRQPAPVSPVGLGIWPAQANAPQARKRNHQAENDEQVDGKKKKPVKSRRNPGSHRNKNYCCLLPKQQRQCHY